MSAILVFEGFKELDAMTEIHGEMLLDVLGLTKTDMDNFPMPDYSQIVFHLRQIEDSEVRDWIITNTYAPVLKSRKSDAMKAFRTFCSDLGWDANEIRESTKLIEDLEELKPIDEDVFSSGSNKQATYRTNSSSGCLSTYILLVVSTALLAFVII